MRISIKQLGAKKPMIKNQELSLSTLSTLSSQSQPVSIRFLIEQVVQSQVERYNQQLDQPDLTTCLSHEDIESQAKHGKVSMGQLAIAAKANLDKAIETALLAFEDGIYCVFIDGEQYESLNESVDLEQNSELVFVRLTLLTGRPY